MWEDKKGKVMWLMVEGHVESTYRKVCSLRAWRQRFGRSWSRGCLDGEQPCRDKCIFFGSARLWLRLKVDRFSSTWLRSVGLKNAPAFSYSCSNSYFSKVVYNITLSKKITKKHCKRVTTKAFVSTYPTTILVWQGGCVNSQSRSAKLDMKNTIYENRT